jgi:lysozyme family protein
MASINAVNLTYIKRWEGGLSRDANDPAAVDSVPDGSGYHTNKGVTWATFKGLAKKIGYNPTAALFYKMPDNIWLAIYKIGYWDPMNGDKINSQGIAELLADWAWGSGPGTAARYVQRYLVSKGYKIAVDGAFGPASTKALNDEIKKAGAKKVFDDLHTSRLNFLKSLPGWQHYGTGWGNRLKDFYNYGIRVVNENPIPTGIILAAVALALYFGFKNGDTKQTFGVKTEQALLKAGGV